MHPPTPGDNQSPLKLDAVRRTINMMLCYAVIVDIQFLVERSLLGGLFGTVPLHRFLVQTWTHRVIKLSPLVQPHVRYSGRIVQHDFCHSARECVRRFVAEHVAHVGTRNDFECATTLPNLIQIVALIHILFQSLSLYIPSRIQYKLYRFRCCIIGVINKITVTQESCCVRFGSF